MKENSAAGSGFPPSPKAIELTLHRLPFPVRREARSAHTTYGSEEGGVGGPPAQALGEREQRSRQWISSLAEGDRVNDVPRPLPDAMGYGRLLHQL